MNLSKSAQFNIVLLLLLLISLAYMFTRDTTMVVEITIGTSNIPDIRIENVIKLTEAESFMEVNLGNIDFEIVCSESSVEPATLGSIVRLEVSGDQPPYDYEEEVIVGYKPGDPEIGELTNTTHLTATDSVGTVLSYDLVVEFKKIYCLS